MGNYRFGTPIMWLFHTHHFHTRRLRFRSDADIVRLTNARITIIIIIILG